MKNVLLFFPFALFVLLSPAIAADKIDHEHQYKSCIALIKSKAEDAFEAALAWRDMGGGEAANHCAALALIELKHYKDAAERLEKLAQDAKSTKEFKAGLLAQAGQTWLMAGNPQRARDVQTAGLSLNPNSIDLLIDRSQSLAAAKLYFDAIDDLNRALEINPSMVDALVFRATAYRYADSFEMAAEDINKALSLNPDHLEALLEKGILERLQGHNDQARSAWMSLLEIAPGSPAAELARANIESMDVDKEK